MDAPRFQFERQRGRKLRMNNEKNSQRGKIFSLYNLFHSNFYLTKIQD